MVKRIITGNMIEGYYREMHQNEMNSGTIKKYFYYSNLFRRHTDEEPVNRGLMIMWRNTLREQFSPVTANSTLAAPDGFFKWFGWEDCAVRLIKVKYRMFCSGQRELSREEYIRFASVTRGEGNERLSPLLRTICPTGIHISELSPITVNVVDKQVAGMDCKGKIRTVFLANGLYRLLEAYAGKGSIISGMIFVTRSERPINWNNIWREMKRISHKAEANPDKVFPHSLRHSFARVYYSQEKDLVRLADMLEHSSVNTTRIYTMESGENHLKQLKKMNLLVSRCNRIPLLL